MAQYFRISTINSKILKLSPILIEKMLLSRATGFKKNTSKSKSSIANMKAKLNHLFRNIYQFFVGKTASSAVPFPRKKEWEDAFPKVNHNL